MLARISNSRISIITLGLLLSLPAAADPTSFKIVALGDSITKAFNANGGFSDSPDVSWSTGTRHTAGFESHLEKIQKLYPQAKVTGFNYAVTGAQSKDLSKQVQKANAAKPDYITLLIGPNDVCHWSSNYQDSLDEFVETLKSNLDSMIAANPKVKITMSGMPDIYRLWELSKDKSSCQRTWSFIGLCKPLLGRGVTNGERQDFKARWDHANAAMETLAAQYPQHIKFSTNAETVEFTSEDISQTDCFHPSIKGQNTLSEGSWKEGWFASALDIASAQ